MRLQWLLLVPWLAFSQEVTQKYWVKWNGEWTTPAQRTFADWSYDYGSQVGRGHTLMWLGYSESSWNVQLNGDGGRSLGPFQMDSTTALWVAKKMGISIQPKEIRTALENDKMLAADMAVWYFEYWYDKHLERIGPGKGHRKIAWKRAIASYRAANRWRVITGIYLLKAGQWVGYFKILHPETQ